MSTIDINDREPPHAEPAAVPSRNATIVGAAMCHRIHHTVESIPVKFFGLGDADYACNTAHSGVKIPNECVVSTRFVETLGERACAARLPERPAAWPGGWANSRSRRSKTERFLPVLVTVVARLAGDLYESMW